MKTLTCASCGAPLEEVPEQPAVRCGFCGAVNEPTVARRPPPAEIRFEVTPVNLEGPVRAASWAVGAALVIPLFGAVIGLGAAVWGVWAALHVHEGALSHLPPMPSDGLRGERRLLVADLRSFHQAGRSPLQVDPPSGGYGAVDPVSLLPWAVTIARGWSKDARLDRIDASRIRRDGTVNVATDPDAEVLYRFSSPSRIATYWRDADLGRKPECECEFWVLSKAGQPFVQLVTGSPSKQELAPSTGDVISLPRIFERGRARIPARPFYNGYMIHSGRDGWVWYLSTLTGRESIPRFRARDGKAL
jgi:hypothetical protein